MAWVFILQGSNGRFYIGSTTDLTRRLDEHQRGSCHTTKRLGTPIALVVCVQLDDCQTARALEFRLKAMKNGAKAVEFLKRNFPV